MSEDLQKMFIEDSPQDVNNLVGAENLSELVIQLQIIMICMKKIKII